MKAKYSALLLLFLAISSCNDNKSLNVLADSASCDELTEISWYRSGEDVEKASKLIQLNNEIMGTNDSYPTDCGEAKEFAIRNAGSQRYATIAPIAFPKMEKEFGGCWCKGFREAYKRKSCKISKINKF